MFALILRERKDKTNREENNFPRIPIEKIRFSGTSEERKTLALNKMEGTAWRVKYCSILFMRLCYTASTIYLPEKDSSIKRNPKSVVGSVYWTVIACPSCMFSLFGSRHIPLLSRDRKSPICVRLVLYNMHEKRKKGCNEPRKQKSFFFFFYTRSRYARHRLFPFLSLYITLSVTKHHG